MASRGWRGREADPAVSADTGAGRGIGRASAIELARMGADILGSGSPSR
jgi:NADP-dependent 3-hydroxy acid dehydrogenase YdfG